MKKIILSAAVILMAMSAKAQGFYGDVSVGYGFGAPNYVMGTKSYTDVLNASNNTKENIYGSVGQGLNIALTPGYMINKHFGVELGINYFIGAKKTIEESTTNLSDIYSIRKAQSNQLRLIPSIVVSSGGDKLSVYAKGGLMIPVLGVTNIDIEGSNITGGGVVKTEAESEFKGHVSVGFRGALGVNYMVNEKLGVFLEVQQTNLFIKQKSNTITSYKVNGNDVLGSMTEEQKVTNYVDEINSSSKPNDALAGKTNFNQFGVNVGVKFNF